MPIELNEKIRDEAEKIDSYLINSTEETVNMFKRLTGKSNCADQVSNQLTKVANNAISNFSNMLKEPTPPKRPAQKQEKEEQIKRQDFDSMFQIISLCEDFSTELSNEQIDPELLYKLEMYIFNIHKTAYDYIKGE